MFENQSVCVCVCVCVCVLKLPFKQLVDKGGTGAIVIVPFSRGNFN
jgi:hypothetical protein